MTYDADVVVIGAGPAGIPAATGAARQDASVIPVERFDMPGPACKAPQMPAWAAREGA